MQRSFALLATVLLALSVNMPCLAQALLVVGADQPIDADISDRGETPVCELRRLIALSIAGGPTAAADATAAVEEILSPGRKAFLLTVDGLGRSGDAAIALLVRFDDGSEDLWHLRVGTDRSISVRDDAGRLLLGMTGLASSTSAPESETTAGP